MRRLALILTLCAWSSLGYAQSVWQWRAEVEGAGNRRGKIGRVVGLLWMAPRTERLRGVLLTPMDDLAQDTQVRQACAEAGLGVLHVDGLKTFPYGAGGADQALGRLLNALARQTGHPELSAVPLLSAGHSTGGLFAKSIAYWQPQRTIGVIYHKSGNLRPPDHDA